MFTCARGTQEQSGDVMKLSAFDANLITRAVAVGDLVTFIVASTCSTARLPCDECVRHCQMKRHSFQL